jgi:hypothetical protein
MSIVRQEIDQTRQLLNQQSKAYICGRLGHGWVILLPLEAREATQEVLCKCKICEEGPAWVTLPQEGYERLLRDVAVGKFD